LLSHFSVLSCTWTATSRHCIVLAFSRDHTYTHTHAHTHTHTRHTQVKILEDSGQLPLAYVAAAVHGLTADAERISAALDGNVPDLPPQGHLLLPPTPILKVCVCLFVDDPHPIGMGGGAQVWVLARLWHPRATFCLRSPSCRGLFVAGCRRWQCSARVCVRVLICLCVARCLPGLTCATQEHLLPQHYFLGVVACYRLCSTVV
jgi:hypothetical protein